MGVVLPQPIQFGKYMLFERIGRGGMADVFKARVQGPAGFERVFVVKRILPHLSDDPAFTRMFIEEAKMSARLNHPNIVQVFELGSVENEYFISMEYVRGRDLAETMRTLWARIGPPRPELVAYVGREMCRALAYAHDLVADDGSVAGMIHRDISPSNVMLSLEGAVKILDFGIAKALGGESEEEQGTQRGTLKGKFAYMAPEQTTGSQVDRRIDIFATGIVLHEILTGRRLFKGENDLQTIDKVRLCNVPPPSLQNPLCPPELDAIVLRALARNRDDRFGSSSDMADSLDDVVHAARFQPTHLAQLMRDLFPTDIGGERRTSGTGSGSGSGGSGSRSGSGNGAARISQAMTGSGSRPGSSGVRSSTVPPVQVPRSGRSPVHLPPPQPNVSTLALPRQRPVWKGPGLWIGAGAAVIAATGGYFFSPKHSASAVGTEKIAPGLRNGSFTANVDSLPAGVEPSPRPGPQIVPQPAPEPTPEPEPTPPPEPPPATVSRPTEPPAPQPGPKVRAKPESASTHKVRPTKRPRRPNPNDLADPFK